MYHFFVIQRTHQEKWTAISRPESGCFNLPDLSLTFTSLQPSTRYKAAVKCRPLGSVFWSGLTTCYFWTNITSKFKHRRNDTANENDIYIKIELNIPLCWFLSIR